METLEIIAEFDGRVSVIEGEIAYISLKDEQGKRSFSKILIKDLGAPEGVKVKELYHFRAYTTKESPDLKYEYIPPRIPGKPLK